MRYAWGASQGQREISAHRSSFEPGPRPAKARYFGPDRQLGSGTQLSRDRIWGDLPDDHLDHD
jgi:hypothetical protein